jgi:hypothetical protein
MSSASPQPFEFTLEVPFGPEWHHIETLRTSILHCLTTLFRNHDFCDKLSMVTAELLENAVQYGTWTHDVERPFRLAVRGTRNQITIEVANPIEGDGEPLRRAVEGILSSGSPKEAYTRRMRELAESPGTNGSGLGLLRIAYETGCHLEATVVERSATVVATFARTASDEQGGVRGVDARD